VTGCTIVNKLSIILQTPEFSGGRVEVKFYTFFNSPPDVNGWATPNEQFSPCKETQNLLYRRHGRTKFRAAGVRKFSPTKWFEPRTGYVIVHLLTSITEWQFWKI